MIVVKDHKTKLRAIRLSCKLFLLKNIIRKYTKMPIIVKSIKYKYKLEVFVTTVITP